MNRAAFDIDLRRGEANEDALVHTFLRSRVEVKTDYKAASTGNVFVEYQQGKPPRASGILVTEAQWWAFHLVGSCWVLVETERLRQLARIARDAFGRKPGGDNDNVGALVPVEWLVRPWKEA